MALRRGSQEKCDRQAWVSHICSISVWFYHEETRISPRFVGRIIAERTERTEERLQGSGCMFVEYVQYLAWDADNRNF